jgi:hypothetical protein
MVISAWKIEKTPANNKTTIMLADLIVQTRSQQPNLAKSEVLMQYWG